jgi:hypothetical protein
MALIRPIRPLPIKPTAAKLRRLMQEYGITCKSAARLMRCDPRSVRLYLQPEGTPGAQRIPLGRFELLILKVQYIFHPDEPVDLPL